MKKGKSIALLSAISILMVLLIAITFIRLPMGVRNFNSILGAIETDYDISGGSVYTFELEEDNSEPVEDINDVLDTLKFRLNKLGYENCLVKAIRAEGNDDYSIRVEVKAPVDAYNTPDYTTLDEDMKVVAKYGQLEFFGGAETELSQEDKIFDNQEVISSVSTELMKDTDGSYYVVSITFTNDAYDYISEKMEEGAFYFKVTLGGEVLSPFDGATALTAESFGKTVYITTASEASAKQMELQITSGGLKYKYTTPERIGNVTSPLGKNVALICLISVATLIVVSIVALIVIYKGFGIVSGLSLIWFMLLELIMLIAVPGIKVSIGSVIGIMVATILTIDGFVITSKRISEEFANGKTVKAAFNSGFKRSLFPIINVSILSAIVSLVLFFATTGQLKSFAITFGIGTVISVIATLLFTRLFVSLISAVSSNKEKLFKLNRKEA